jgi:hypothetical protein
MKFLQEGEQQQQQQQQQQQGASTAYTNLEEDE